MSALTELKEQMEAIPGKRQRSDLVGKLEQYRDQAQKVLQSADRVLAGMNGLLKVFADTDVSSLNEKVQKAGSIAKRLADQLRKSPDKVKSDTTSENFASMSDLTSATEQLAKQRWRNLIQDRVEGFQRLVDAAREADLPGSETMTESLAYLMKAASAPPTALGAAGATLKALEDLKTSIAGLGLAGSPGKFLIQAAQGKADLSLLDDVEVRDFIKTHHLERLIKIKLG